MSEPSTGHTLVTAWLRDLGELIDACLAQRLTERRAGDAQRLAEARAIIENTYGREEPARTHHPSIHDQEREVDLCPTCERRRVARAWLAAP